MKTSAIFTLMILWTTSAHAWSHLIIPICEPLGIPSEIVSAIIQVESEGQPYVINVGMNDSWKAYPNDEPITARSLLNEALLITPLIDVGLMQVNVYHWVDKLDILPQDLLDIETNIWAGCTILAQELNSNSCDFWACVGRYHSRTPWRNAAYIRKVQYALRNPMPFDHS